MEANELRLGNYIMDSPINGNKPLEVHTIYSNLVIHEDTHIYNDEIRPIPLSSEWLRKLGFEGHVGELKKGRFAYLVQQRFFVVEGYEHDYNGINCHPEYVHELQNLYFALTGEELSIK